MYADSPYGWDYKFSDTYEQITTSLDWYLEHGGTTKVEHGTGPIIIPFPGVRRDASNGFSKINRNAVLRPVNYIQEQTSIRQVSPINRVPADHVTFIIDRRSKEFPSYSGPDFEYVCFDIFPGMLTPYTSMYYSDPARRTEYEGIDTDWDSTARFTWSVSPCIHVRRYNANNGNLIQSGYYYPENISDKHYPTSLFHFARQTRYAGYCQYTMSPTGGAIIDPRQYYKDFAGCGLAIVFESGDISTTIDNGNYIFDVFRPSLAIISENTDEIYGGTVGNAFKETSMLVLKETSSEVQRLGLQYDLLTGEELPLKFVLSVNNIYSETEIRRYAEAMDIILNNTHGGEQNDT
jgi:hypothetical protein